MALIFSFTNHSTKEEVDFKPLELDVGEEFTALEYPSKMYVLNYTMKDVTGDGINDMVLAIGEKEKIDDIEANNIDVVIYEPNEKIFLTSQLKNMNGRMPKIETYDVTGDGVLDILLLMEQDKINVVRGIQIENGKAVEILKEKDNKGIIISGQFLDGFQAKVKSSKYNKETVLTLMNRKENYVENGFYDTSGRMLKKDVTIRTTPFVHIEMVQLDGYYGIQTTQRLLGFNEEDLLDEITVIWKYENKKWVAKEARGNVIGNILY